LGTPITITTNIPVDTGACKNNDMTLIAAASGTPAPSVQWQVSTDNGATWNNISGATNPNYTITGANTNQDGWKYRAVFSNSCGTAITNAMLLHVGAPINLGANPADQTACNGNTSVTFTSSGNGGNGLVTMSWQYSADGINWIDIAGTTTTSSIGTFSTSYTFTPNASQNGYKFRAKYSNGGCAASYDLVPATLTVNPVPVLTSPVSDQIVCNGANTTAVNFTGTNATSFTWTNNTASIGLAASGTGNIPAFTAINNGSSAVTATITVTPVYSGGSPRN